MGNGGDFVTPPYGLVLERRVGESFKIIGPDGTVTTVWMHSIGRVQARVRIYAPDSVGIVRTEIYNKGEA